MASHGRGMVWHGRVENGMAWWRYGMVWHMAWHGRVMHGRGIAWHVMVGV